MNRINDSTSARTPVAAPAAPEALSSNKARRDLFSSEVKLATLHTDVKNSSHGIEALSPFESHPNAALKLRPARRKAAETTFRCSNCNSRRVTGKWLFRLRWCKGDRGEELAVLLPLRDVSIRVFLVLFLCGGSGACSGNGARDGDSPRRCVHRASCAVHSSKLP